MAILFSGDFHNNSCGELSIITKDSLLNRYGEELYNKIKFYYIYTHTLLVDKDKLTVIKDWGEKEI